MQMVSQGKKVNPPQKKKKNLNKIFKPPRTTYCAYPKQVLKIVLE